MKKTLISAVLLLVLCSLIGCTNAASTAQTTAIQTTAIQTTTAAASTTQAETTSTTTATTATAPATTKATTTKAAKQTTKKAAASTTSTTKPHTKQKNLCYITVECSAALENMDKLKEGHEEYVPENGIILSKTACSFKDGETVFDVLKRVCTDRGINLSARDTIYGTYVSGINFLDEFDCGSASGWVYTVNSKSPSISCSEYKLSAEDEIIFKFIAN